MTGVRKPSVQARTVHVSVPATTANLGPGFDCLGLALELRNEVTLVSKLDMMPYDAPIETIVELEVNGLDAEKVPQNRRNLLLTAADKVFLQVGRRPAELRVKMTIHIPIGSGLGSSSSAIIAGMLGANALVDGGLTEEELLSMAVEMEGHPDNIAPALLGGLVLGILPDSKFGPPSLLIRKLSPPDLFAIIVLPDFFLPTEEARAVLPEQVSRNDAIFNTSRLGLLLHSLLMNDYRQLAIAMADKLHQPYRLTLIPGADRAYSAAYDAGAMGVALSGAGPSLIAFATMNPEPIAEAMMVAFGSAGLGCRHWILQPAEVGAICTTSPGNSVQSLIT